MSWVDERLAAAGIERTGQAEQTHLRPWSTVLRVPTTVGPTWMKATGSGAAFEAGLYELLARHVPGHVLTPIGLDTQRGWMLLPDGGPVLGERDAGPGRVDAMVSALVQYGRLQRELAPRVDDLLAIGVADMRPAAMLERFGQALEAVDAALDHRDGAAHEMLRSIAAMEPTVRGWCERLQDAPQAASLDHNDLHPWNILDDGAGRVRYYDWGDSVVAHPFAAMLVPLGFVRHELDATLEDPRYRHARDAYLAVFADVAPHEELVETLALACNVAKIARALTWERALESARDENEEIDANWTSAPLESLASLLDASYLGRA